MPSAPFRQTVALAGGGILAALGLLAAWARTAPAASVAILLGAALLIAAGIDAMRTAARARRQLEWLRASKRRALERVAERASHDIVNALTAVASQADLLAEDRPADLAVQRATGAILATCDKISGHAALLSACSSRLFLRPERFELNEALAVCRAALDRPGEIPLAVALAPQPLPVLVDKDRLLACIGHLVDNARVAGGAEPVTLRTLAEGGMAVVEVVDRGIGMSSDVLAQACDPYFGTWGRTGLGLSVVQGFANQSGGQLDLLSAPGQGTVARLRLPLALSAAPAGAPPVAAPAVTAALPPPALSAEAGAWSTLVVDDNDVARRGLAEALRRAGLEVIEARDAAEARGLLTPAIDAVITDVVLPGDMDGFALGQWVRDRNPLVPLVFTTGFMSTRQPGRLAHDDLTGFVRKPIVTDQLLAVLGGLLAVRDARRAGAVGRR